MIANIFIVCPGCGEKQRVEVNFKNLKSKFDTCTTNCTKCGIELLVTDENDLEGDEE